MDLVQKEQESVPEYFGRTRDILPCLDPEDECWLVDVFISGLIDESIQEALRTARKGNKSMTLLQAYKQLEILASSGDKSEIAFNYFGNCSSEDSETVHKIDLSTTGRCQGFWSIAVQDIPGYILVDAVAFQQFLLMNRLQPYYQARGRYSEESIRILHNEFSQLAEEEITDVTPLMKASAKMALLQQQLRHHSLGNKIEITMMELAATNQGVASPDHSQYKAIYLEAETEPRAIRSDEWAKSYQNTMGGREVEKWCEKTDIKCDEDTEQEVIVMSLGAKGDSSAQDQVGSGWKPEAVEAPERERRAEVGNNRWTTEPGNSNQPCSSDSDEFSSDAIQNPSIRPIRTASEWDPGPYKMTDAIPVTKSGKDPYAFSYRDPREVERHTAEEKVPNPNGIVVKTMSREPVRPVREYQWPPEFRVQRAYHTLLTKPRRNFYGRSARVLWKIGRGQRGGNGVHRLWDLGGGRVESLSTAGRWRKDVKASGMGCNGGE